MENLNEKVEAFFAADNQTFRREKGQMEDFTRAIMLSPSAQMTYKALLKAMCEYDLTVEKAIQCAFITGFMQGTQFGESEGHVEEPLC